MSNFFTSFFKDASDKLSASTNNISETSPSMIVLVVLSLLLLLFIIIYTIIKLKKNTLTSVTFIKTPVQPSQELMQYVASENQLPPLNNGNEFAYSFWLYVDSLNDLSDHNLIFLQSGSSGLDDVNFKNTTMIVYIEKGTSKLKFKLRTANADQNAVQIDITTPSGSKLGIDGILHINGSDTIIKDGKNITNKDLNKDTCYYSEYVIDYLPLQKWVNIIINIENNFVSIFLDGDLLNTHNLASSDSNSNCPNSALSNIISNKSGNIFVGSDHANQLVSFKGYLSKFQIFNYSITIDYVKTIYNQGPLGNSVLNTIGIPLYRLRNPIYKIDEIITPQAQATTI
jgi:hypothetical protein